MTKILERLKEISTPPHDAKLYELWLELKDAIDFLKDSVEDHDFIVYAAAPYTFVHGVLVPTISVSPPDVDDLMAWNCNATSTWSVDIAFSQPPSISISSPLDHTGSKTLDQGEQLVFARMFEGRVGKKNYYEILQKFIHVSCLHFVPESNSFCRLDKHGDVEEVVRIIEVSGRGDGRDTNVVTIKREVLDDYLALTDSAIVRTFDVTRYSQHFGGWSEAHAEKITVEEDIFYRSHIEPGHASYMRGCQIVHSRRSKESVIKRLDPKVHEERQYASFIAQDWKHKIVREISCAPGYTANYFTPSDLPFELSPAFFRPEVLSKYKTDSDKYRLEDRSIQCRGAWHLQTYDINDAGQVHTYLVYLRNLPFEEQLYWKSYNEIPRAPISKRAIETDFKGNWYLEHDPLSSLKEKIRELDHLQLPWWTLRSEKLLDAVHYPVTSSADEWANEILHLDQLVIEGFESKWLRTKAQSLGRNPDAKFGSIKLVEECPIALGFSADDASGNVASLRKIHELRTKLKGHASAESAQALKQQAINDHGSYKKHFRDLCGECDESIKLITEAFKKLD